MFHTLEILAAKGDKLARETLNKIIEAEREDFRADYPGAIGGPEPLLGDVPKAHLKVTEIPKGGGPIGGTYFL